MKYLYKHGNQFWYQRAVPKSLYNHIRKKSIKICLKTNKLEIAICRAKQQSKKHNEMFQNLLSNNKNYLSNLIKPGNLNLKKFQIEFKEDHQDLVEDFLFSKKKFIENFSISEKIKINNTSLDKYLFYDDYLSNSRISKIIDDCLDNKIDYFPRLESVTTDEDQLNFEVSFAQNFSNDPPNNFSTSLQQQQWHKQSYQFLCPAPSQRYTPVAQ